MRTELQVIQDFYDFTLWLMRHTEKFPRHHRYSLGAAIEAGLQRILELLLRAKFTRDKTETLRNANIELEILRFQLRLAKDMRALPVKSHRHAAQCMQAIGSQIGGWLAGRRRRQ